MADETASPTQAPDIPQPKLMGLDFVPGRLGANAALPVTFNDGKAQTHMRLADGALWVPTGSKPEDGQWVRLKPGGGYEPAPATLDDKAWEPAAKDATFGFKTMKGVDVQVNPWTNSVQMPDKSWVTLGHRDEQGNVVPTRLPESLYPRVKVTPTPEQAASDKAAYDAAPVQTGLTPEQFAAGKAEAEARIEGRKPLGQRIFEGVAHGVQSADTQLFAAPSGLLRMAGKLTQEHAGMTLTPGVNDAIGKGLEQLGDILRPTDFEKNVKDTAPKTTAGKIADVPGAIFGTLTTLPAAGTNMLAAMAAQSMGNKANEALDAGASPDKAAGVALLHGGLTYLTGKVFQGIQPQYTSTGQTIAGQAIKGAGFGGTLGILGNLIDKYTFDPNRKPLDNLGPALASGMAYELTGLPGQLKDSFIRKAAVEHPEGPMGFMKDLMGAQIRAQYHSGEIILDAEGNPTKYNQDFFERFNQTADHMLDVAEDALRAKGVKVPTDLRATLAAQAQAETEPPQQGPVKTIGETTAAPSAPLDRETGIRTIPQSPYPAGAGMTMTMPDGQVVHEADLIPMRQEAERRLSGNPIPMPTSQQAYTRLEAQAHQIALDYQQAKADAALYPHIELYQKRVHRLEDTLNLINDVIGASRTLDMVNLALKQVTKQRNIEQKAVATGNAIPVPPVAHPDEPQLHAGPPERHTPPPEPVVEGSAAPAPVSGPADTIAPAPPAPVQVPKPAPAPVEIPGTGTQEGVTVRATPTPSGTSVTIKDDETGDVLPSAKIFPPGQEAQAQEYAKNLAAGKPTPKAEEKPLVSKSGRVLTPPKMGSLDSDRKVQNVARNMDKWLHAEALKEVSDNDPFKNPTNAHLTTLLEGVNPEKMTDGDRSMVNEILFGDADGRMIPVGGPEKAPKSAAPAAFHTPYFNLGDQVVQEAQSRPLQNKDLVEMSKSHFGNQPPVKALYDAVEAGVNRWVMQNMGPANFKNNEHIKDTINTLETLTKNLPTQVAREGGATEMQQFSTPPAYAAAVAYATGITPKDTVLEPSAGTGGLASMAEAMGAKDVHTNEFDKERRAKLLQGMGFEATTEDARHLNAIHPDLHPSVVLMNPPFSSTSGKQVDKRDMFQGAGHVGEALKMLAPGGRLVAIVGDPMSSTNPKFKNWFAKMAKDGNALRADVGMSRDVYKKYGTTFPTRVLIFDKGTTDAPVVTGTASDPANLTDLLEGVRNDRLSAVQPATPNRPAVEPSPVQPAGKEPAEEGGGAVGSAKPVPAPAVRNGAGEGLGTRPGPGGASGAPEAGGVEQRGPRDASGGPGKAAEQPGGVVEPAVGGPAGPASPAGSDGRPAPAAVEPKPDTGANAGGNPPEPGGVSEGRPAEPVLSPSAGLSIGKSAEQQAQDLSKDSVFSEYHPSKVQIPGSKPHKGELVESAAMASVDPPNPDPNFKLHLPQKLITSGDLSDAQLENIYYAALATSKTLDNGEAQGFVIGDGTGVGKGREIAGFISHWLNAGAGKGKAVWFSKNADLAAEALRDWEALGRDKADFHSLADTPSVADKEAKTVHSIKAKKGLLYATYGLMAPNQRSAVPDARMKQLQDWLGKDFDGPIVLDEAHLVSNTGLETGERGNKDGSLRAKALEDVQKAFPKAKVLYVTATMASDPSQLGFLNRLGLWGAGKPTLSGRDFVASIDQMGIAGMEIVARDLKARGIYMARSLSFNGVEYSNLQHNLTPAQKSVYDEAARSWQIVLKHVNQVIEDITGGGKKARSAALSKFYGQQLAFFNSLMTSLMLPTVTEEMQRQLDAGHSVVVQLTETGEARQGRAIEAETKRAMEQGEEADIAGIDLSPKDILIQFLKSGFPIHRYEEVTNEEGKTSWQMVRDGNGNPVVDPEAVQRREQLISDVASLNMPGSALDELVKHFGPDQVAEATGRSERRVFDAEGNAKLQKLGNNAVMKDVENFQAGRKRILIFSKKANTGMSFHSSLAAANQQRRVHIVLQPGWRADEAIQGLGRTHRTAQANAPHYILASTDLGGHKRFMSTIARRISQLGALTRGQREASGGSLFSERDNLESPTAARALKRLYEDLYKGNVLGPDNAPYPINGFMEKTGLKLLDEKAGGLLSDLPEMSRFLNRLLTMEFAEQNAIFNHFSENLDQQFAHEEQSGMLEQGLQTLHASSAVEKVRDDFAVDKDSGAKTTYHQIEAQYPVTFLPFEKVNTGDSRFKAFYRSPGGKVPYAVTSRGKTTDPSGRTVERFQFKNPAARDEYRSDPDFNKLEELSTADAKMLWDLYIKEHPPTRTETHHIVSGAMLHLLKRFVQPANAPIRVVRLKLDDGRVILGRLLPPAQVEENLRSLGATKGLDAAEAAVRQMTGRDTLNAVQSGQTVDLSQFGYQLKPWKQYGEIKAVLIGPSTNTARRQLVDLYPGFRVEDVQGRYGRESILVIPNTPEAADNLTTYLKSNPPTKVRGTSSRHGEQGSISLDMLTAPFQAAYQIVKAGVENFGKFAEAMKGAMGSRFPKVRPGLKDMYGKAKAEVDAEDADAFSEGIKRAWRDSDVALRMDTKDIGPVESYATKKPYDIGQKYRAEFKPVYDKATEYQQIREQYVNQHAEVPREFNRLGSKRIEALTRVLTKGRLEHLVDEEGNVTQEGVVYTDEQLQKMGMDDQQIEVYHQVLQLGRQIAADMVRSQRQVTDSVVQSYKTLLDMQPRVAGLNPSELADELQAVEDNIKSLESRPNPPEDTLAFLNDYRDMLKAGADNAGAFRKAVQRKIANAERAFKNYEARLTKNKAYFPLQRFGKVKVEVKESVPAEGGGVRDLTRAVGLAEIQPVDYLALLSLRSPSDAAANREGRRILRELGINPNELGGLGPDVRVEAGNKYQPYSDVRVTPSATDLEWLEVVAKEIGLDTPEASVLLTEAQRRFLREGTRSFKRHLLEAKGTAGYSLQGDRALSEYILSAANAMAYAKVGQKLGAAVADIDSKAFPRLKAYAERFMADTLAPRPMAPVNQKLMALTALYMLGGKFTFVLQNSYQYAVTERPAMLADLKMYGVPAGVRSGVAWGISGWAQAKAAQFQMLQMLHGMGQWLAEREDRAGADRSPATQFLLDQDPLKAFGDAPMREAVRLAHEHGQFMDRQSAEISSIHRGEQTGAKKIADRLMQAALLPASLSEQNNRIRAFLARAKMAQDFGKADATGMLKAGESMVSKAHFDYSSINKTPLEKAGAGTGQVLSIFQYFTVRVAHLLGNLFREQFYNFDPEGMKRSKIELTGDVIRHPIKAIRAGTSLYSFILAGLAAAGLRAFQPLMDMMDWMHDLVRGLYERIWGQGYDPTTHLDLDHQMADAAFKFGKSLGYSDSEALKMSQAVRKGLPTYAGVDLSPFLKPGLNFFQHDNPKESGAEELAGYLGAAGNVVSSALQFKKDVEAGDQEKQRKILPRSVRSMQEAAKGKTRVGAIEVPLDGLDAKLWALNITPGSVSLARDLMDRQGLRTERLDRAKNIYLKPVLKSMDDYFDAKKAYDQAPDQGTYNTMTQAHESFLASVKRIEDYNLRMAEKPDGAGMPYIIDKATIVSSATQHAKEEKAPILGVPKNQRPAYLQDQKQLGLPVVRP